MSTRSLDHSDVLIDDALILHGLDGTNPLGFLAAMGLFHVLDSALGNRLLRMTWRPSGATWVPALYCSNGEKLSRDQVLHILSLSLASSVENHPVVLLTELDGASEDQVKRRNILRDTLSGTDRARMNWAAALASDAAPADAINQLQTARRDYFYGNLASVIRRSDRGHLDRAIFSPWDYADALDNQSLHWDPSEDRRHAHQWNKPAGDPDRKKNGGMLGANRLALEALQEFPSFPEANTLRTLGFTGNRSTNTRWSWPIWGVGITLPIMRSLLAAPVFQVATMNKEHIDTIRAMGVVAVYRTHRILVGKTPNFTPARCIA